MNNKQQFISIWIAIVTLLVIVLIQRDTNIKMFNILESRIEATEDVVIELIP